jgi:hypothetical protein
MLCDESTLGSELDMDIHGGHSKLQREVFMNNKFLGRCRKPMTKQGLIPEV